MQSMTIPRDYSGAFEPLPQAIRDRHPDMFGWEFTKRSIPEEQRWEPTGYSVITPGGITSYDLNGVAVRDRVIYR